MSVDTSQRPVVRITRPSLWNEGPATRLTRLGTPFADYSTQPGSRPSS